MLYSVSHAFGIRNHRHSKAHYTLLSRLHYTVVGLRVCALEEL